MGKRKSHIRSLQELARCTLVHAHHRWPSAITANLWPYAVRHACESLNSTPSARHRHKRSPMQVLSRSDIEVNHRHWLPLFCPAYVLNRNLQTSGIQNKWAERASPGVYLGRSPLHARSISLVLNLQTGRVSPQYHVSMDPTFATVSGRDGNNPPISNWQVQCGFKRGRRSQQAFDERYSVEPQFIQPSDAGAQARVDASEMSSTVPRMEGTEENPAGEPPPPLPGESFGDPEPMQEEGLRRSPRVGKGSSSETRYQDMAWNSTVEGEILCYQTTTDKAAQQAATGDPDTMYYHQARKEDDWREFERAMQSEMDGQMEDRNYSVVL